MTKRLAARIKSSVWVAVVALIVVPGCAQDPTSASPQPSQETAQKSTKEDRAIRHLIVEYAASVGAANTEQAAQIWSHSPEVSFIHPLGEEHGFDQIKENVYTRLMGQTFMERSLQIRDISVHVYGKAAWAEFNWDFHAKFRKDGSPLTTHGRESQFYRKEKDGWKLVHVHYSPMPEAKAGNS